MGLPLIWRIQRQLPLYVAVVMGKDFMNVVRRSALVSRILLAVYFARRESLASCDWPYSRGVSSVVLHEFDAGSCGQLVYWSLKLLSSYFDLGASGCWLNNVLVTIAPLTAAVNIRTHDLTCDMGYRKICVELRKHI